nr:hypothetical protein [Tanacetum cinerariifolium]
MAEHSQKWHEGTSSRNISSSSDTDGLAAVISKLNNLGRDMKKLKENVHEIQIKSQICEGPDLGKECPLNKEVKQVDEVMYGEFRRPTPFNGNSGAKFRIGFLSDEKSKTTEVKTSKAIPEWKSNLPKQMEDLKTKYLTKYCPRAQTAKKMEEINNFKQEPDETLYQAWERFKELLMKFPQHYLTEMQEEKDPGSFTLPYYINNVFFNNALADLGASVSVMPFLTYLNLGLDELAHTMLTVELAYRIVKYLKGIAENVLVGIGKFVFFVILDMPEGVKVPLIIGRPFLSIAHAKIYVFKRKITLRVRDKKIIFKSMKPASSLIKRVYMLGLRECMELDLEARLMGETLVLNRSLDPSYGDYIKLNDLKVPS